MKGAATSTTKTIIQKIGSNMKTPDFLTFGIAFDN
jgi:hypothetical protein